MSNILIMTEDKKKELQSAAFERLLHHLDERKDVQNIDIMNLAGFCRNCLSRWYREEAEKKNISITDPEAREHVDGAHQHGHTDTEGEIPGDDRVPHDGE